MGFSIAISLHLYSWPDIALIGYLSQCLVPKRNSFGYYLLKNSIKPNMCLWMKIVDIAQCSEFSYLDSRCSRQDVCKLTSLLLRSAGFRNQLVTTETLWTSNVEKHQAHYLVWELSYHLHISSHSHQDQLTRSSVFLIGQRQVDRSMGEQDQGPCFPNLDANLGHEVEHPQAAPQPRSNIFSDHQV